MVLGLANSKYLLGMAPRNGQFLEYPLLDAIAGLLVWAVNSATAPAPIDDVPG